jgi:hypothetical protein
MRKLSSFIGDPLILAPLFCSLSFTSLCSSSAETWFIINNIFAVKKKKVLPIHFHQPIVASIKPVATLIKVSKKLT